jgi:hypothetical protein
VLAGPELIQPEEVANVVLAFLPVVICERLHKEPVRGIVGEPDGEASVMTAVAGTGAENAPARDFTAKKLGSVAEVHQDAPPVSAASAFNRWCSAL